MHTETFKSTELKPSVVVILSNCCQTDLYT